MLNQYLEAGRIVGTHGLAGELRVDPWCDSAELLAKLKTLYWDKGTQKLDVVSSRVHKTLLLLQLRGIDTIEQADTLRGKILYLNRADLPLEEGANLISQAPEFNKYARLVKVEFIFNKYSSIELCLSLI